MLLSATTFVMLLTAAPAGDADRLLFDPTRGTTPEAQQWVYLTTPLLGSKCLSRAEAGHALLDTTAAPAENAGYFAQHPICLPVLDRRRGLTLNFTARLVDETHLKPNRAGFSVLLVCGDLRAIELGFWRDQVFAQSGADFQRAESAACDTAARAVDYCLRVEDEGYVLSAAGQELLRGKLRDYSAHRHPVYRTPNLIFLGDDTTSAAAKVELGEVRLKCAGVNAAPENGANRD